MTKHIISLLLLGLGVCDPPGDWDAFRNKLVQIKATISNTWGCVKSRAQHEPKEEWFVRHNPRS